MSSISLWSICHILANIAEMFENGLNGLRVFLGVLFIVGVSAVLAILHRLPQSGNHQIITVDYIQFYFHLRAIKAIAVDFAADFASITNAHHFIHNDGANVQVAPHTLALWPATFADCTSAASISRNCCHLRAI
jgi:hypothetical protein